MHVQEEAIALIACLAADVELVWHQSAIEGVHNMILKVMESNPDEVDLAEVSLEALGKSSSNNVLQIPKSFTINLKNVLSCSGAEQSAIFI